MTIIYIIITLLILSLLILVHEYGHFLAARLMGVRVIEFSLGMGPAIFKKQTSKTLYAFRILPIGGYCRLQGEELEEIEGDELDEIDVNPSESFVNKPAWMRFIILIAGVSMNFVLAFLIIFIAALLSGRGFLDSISLTWTLFIQMFGLIFFSLKMLFTGEAGVNDLAGPVGMVQIVGEYYQYGFITLMLFTAMLSVNLGILNLLPIPALDGGQVMLLIIESLKRGKLSQKLKERLILISYAFLIFLAVIVAFNDIWRMLS